jgi:hypothetical protein
VVTGGTDYRAVADLTAHKPQDEQLYTARDVIEHLTE